jgi:translation elongation factor EF-Tu-like GTPase
MTFLFKIEEVFEIAGRGCVIVPVIVEGADFKIRPRDGIQLRTPEGRTLNTQIGSVEFLKPAVGACRMGILLPSDVRKQDVPNGSEVWLTQGR